MDPGELIELVKGKTDEQIYSALAASSTGARYEIENLIDEVASGMAAAFDESAAEGQSAVIQYDITTPEGPYGFQLLIEDGVCTHTRDRREKPRVYLMLSLPNLLRLVTGNLSGQEAYFSGLLRVGGDFVLSMQLESWFKRPGKTRSSDGSP